jgi:hypothetical protein
MFANTGQRCGLCEHVPKAGRKNNVVAYTHSVENILYERKYPALLGIEDKVNCYLPTASTM